MAEKKGLREFLAGTAAGFLMTAASVCHRAVPLAMGLLWLRSWGWRGAVALGASAGYWIFWQESQGAVWMGFGLLAVLALGDSTIAAQQKLLMPALASLVVSASGVWFLFWRLDDTPVDIYLV